MFYQTINLLFPTNVYKVDLKAGDVMAFKLSWATTNDLDLYLYQQGQDFLNRSTNKASSLGTALYS